MYPHLLNCWGNEWVGQSKYVGQIAKRVGQKKRTDGQMNEKLVYLNLTTAVCKREETISHVAMCGTIWHQATVQ